MPQQGEQLGRRDQVECKRAYDHVHCCPFRRWHLLDAGVHVELAFFVVSSSYRLPMHDCLSCLEFRFQEEVWSSMRCCAWEVPCRGVLVVHHLQYLERRVPHMVFQSYCGTLHLCTGSIFGRMHLDGTPERLSHRISRQYSQAIRKY